MLQDKLSSCRPAWASWIEAQQHELSVHINFSDKLHCYYWSHWNTPDNLWMFLELMVGMYPHTRGVTSSLNRIHNILSIFVNHFNAFDVLQAKLRGGKRSGWKVSSFCVVWCNHLTNAWSSFGNASTRQSWYYDRNMVISHFSPFLKQKINILKPSTFLCLR